MESSLKIHITRQYRGDLIKVLNLKIKKQEDNNIALRKLNSKLNTENGILRTRLDSIDKPLNRYQCCMCKFESGRVDKIRKHMFRNHPDTVKEVDEDLYILSVEDCCVLRKVFYNSENLKKHEEKVCMCFICQLCMRIT